MQNIRKMIFYSLFIFLAQTCHLSRIIAFGNVDVKVVVPTELTMAIRGVQESADKSVPLISAASENFAKNAGMGLYESTKADVVSAASRAKAAALYTATAAKSAGSYVTATASAHPIVTTIVLTTVVIVIISYASYKIYRYFKPATSSVEEAKMKLEIAKCTAEIAKLKVIEEKANSKAKIVVAKAQSKLQAIETKAFQVA